MKTTSGLLVSGLALVLFAGTTPAWAASSPATPPATSPVAAYAAADSVASDPLRTAGLRLTGRTHVFAGDAATLFVSDRETDLPVRARLSVQGMAGSIKADGDGRYSVVFTAPGTYRLLARLGDDRSNVFQMVVTENPDSSCAGGAPATSDGGGCA